MPSHDNLFSIKPQSDESLSYSRSLQQYSNIVRDRHLYKTVRQFHPMQAEKL